MKKALYFITLISSPAFADEGKKIHVLPTVDTVVQREFRLEDIGKAPAVEQVIGIYVERKDADGRGFRLTIRPKPKQVVTLRVTF